MVRSTAARFRPTSAASAAPRGWGLPHRRRCSIRLSAGGSTSQGTELGSFGFWCRLGIWPTNTEGTSAMPRFALLTRGNGLLS
jgi:hypothetical protein